MASKQRDIFLSLKFYCFDHNILKKKKSDWTINISEIILFEISLMFHLGKAKFVQKLAFLNMYIYIYIYIYILIGQAHNSIINNANKLYAQKHRDSFLFKKII